MILIEQVHFGLPIYKSHTTFLMQITHIKVAPTEAERGDKAEQISERPWKWKRVKWEFCDSNAARHSLINTPLLLP